MTAPVIRREVWEGARQEVADRCLAASQQGRLVRMTRPVPAARYRDRVKVAVLLAGADPTPAPTPSRRATSSTPTAGQIAAGAAVTCGTVAAGGAVYLLAQFVRWVDAHRLQVGLVLAVLLVALVFCRPNHRPACPGLHCPGCRG